MGMTESQAEAWGDDTERRQARCAGEEARSNNILSCWSSILDDNLDPLAWWGLKDVLDTYSIGVPNDMVEVIDGLLQMVVRCKGRFLTD